MRAISTRLCVIASLGLILLVVAACAPVPTATAVPPAATSTIAAPKVVPTPTAPSGPKILRLGLGTYPDVIDPQKPSFVYDIAVLQLCYEGLTLLDAKGNVGPGASDKWELSKDGTMMIFHVRDGLKRADGAAMNASDFEYALRRQVDPRITGKEYYAIVVRDIKGAGPLLDAEGQKLSDAELKKMYDTYGVKSDDAKRELYVTFEKPIGFWRYVASTWVTFVPDKKQVDAAPDSWWVKPDGHNCYGPFKIKTMEYGKRIVYEANPYYWRGKPILERIEANYITDEAKRLEAYKKGELDATEIGSSTLDLVNIDVTLKAELVRYPVAWVTAFAFNNSRKPFNDKNVRIAFSLAFDREGWVRDVQKGMAKPYARWIPPGVPGAQADKPGVPAYDPKAAVDTLIKNGYGTADGKKVDCAKLGELRLTFSNATPQNYARFQFLAGNFARVFNCPITLDPVDSNYLTALTKDPKLSPQISRQWWLQDYPHPHNWLSMYWKCESFSQSISYCNKDLDALMDKADATLNSDEAIKLYQQAEEILLKDVPAAFVHYNENLFVVKPYLLGVKENLSSSDIIWPSQFGPVWTYDIDLTKIPVSYPKQ